MFGFNPSTFSDPFDVNAVAGANNRERAKLKSQSFLTDSALGGAATNIQAKNKAEDIMAKAQASARSTSNNAAMIGGALDFAGSLGSFGAGGGFGGGGGVPGDGGAAAGLTMPGSKGYDFFADPSNQPNFMGDYTFDFSKSYFPK
jgi:hypothetical protein